MKDKLLIKTLKEFKNFYEQSLLQAKRDGKKSYLPKIREKVNDIDKLLEKYS